MKKQLAAILSPAFNVIIQLKKRYHFLYRYVLSYTSKYPILTSAIYITVTGNVAFWTIFQKLNTGSIWHVILFTVSFFFLIVTFTSILLHFVRFKYLFKPALIIILIASSFASYFMNNYGVMFDTSMIYNLAETDTREAGELAGFGVMFYVLLVGVVPAMIIFKSRIKYSSAIKQVFQNSITIGLLLALLAGNFLLFSPHYTSFFRNHHHARYLINPVNYIYSVGKYLSQNMIAEDKTAVKIGLDAKQDKGTAKKSRRSVILLVVGETARARNFSLNGYDRQTNPLLEKHKEILNYTHFSSCGTSTHVSLPCMFSKFGRDEFDEARAKRYEKLPDVLQRAGLNVSWKDNNSGCKGVCKNIPTENTHLLHLDYVCNDASCFDEAMLVGLKDTIESKNRDTVIILHQQGSHGPAYYLRHPNKFQKFMPECTSNELNNCSSQEIINAYDNTIVYTDFFLEKVISLLKKETEKFDTAMLYISDHGESLGEHNVYLHSLPYLIAPEEQKHVPFITWFSDSFIRNNQLDVTCLKNNVDNAYSHDNFFHTVLGLTHVTTALYKPELDIFRPCKETPAQFGHLAEFTE